MKAGIIRLFELHLGWPLHWLVCMLHGNELPLRHLFTVLDGKINGPQCFTGDIGKELKDYESKVIVQFNPIPGNLPPVDANILSTDQKYLYEIHTAVSTGIIPEGLASRSPGCLNHARWLTTANRLLRIYVST